MTAKTTLVQLHHKIATFEHLNKHLVLAMQDCLLEYMRRRFNFGHITGVRGGDPMHFHAYEIQKQGAAYRLELNECISTDGNGIAQCLDLQQSAKVELDEILRQLEAKLPMSVLLTLGTNVGTIPVPTSAAIEASQNG